MATKSPRKRGRPSKELLKPDLLSVYHSVVNPETFKRLTEKLVQLAEEGDKDLLKYVHDRGLGRPRESVDVTSGQEKLTMQLYLPEKKARTDK